MLVIDSLVTDSLLDAVDQIEMHDLLTSILDDVSGSSDQIIQGDFCELIAELPEDCI